MGCKINTTTISKLLSSLTEYFDSEYRGKLYNITNFHVSSGCNELDNFLSSIYKVGVTVRLFANADALGDGTNNDQEGTSRHSWTDRQFNFICKSTIVEESPDNLEKYYWNILFTKEKLVYDFLKEMGQELKCFGEEKDVIPPLCPKMYHCYSEGENYSCIILQDLVSLGYYMTPFLAQEGQGLSLQECKLIMTRLAQFHALSLVLEGKQGCLLPLKYEICTTELLFSTGVEPALRPVTYASYQGVLKLVEKFRPTDLFPKLKRIDDDENIWNRLCEWVKPGQSSFSFSCLCHGDPRLNNIFVEKKKVVDPSSSFTAFSNKQPSTNATTNNAGNNDLSEEQKEKKSKVPSTTTVDAQKEQEENEGDPPAGLRFIDFQMTRYASPLTDLQYCLHMGTNREFREKYTDQVLETYFNEFVAVLGRYPDVQLVQAEGVGGWTLDKLKQEYEQFYMYGFLVSLILLPMILLRPGEDIDKSMSQMTKAERTQFFTEGRAELIYNIGSRNETLRQRLFEMCEEMVAKNVM